MKKKVLISLTIVALFAVAMTFNSQKNEIKNLTLKNLEAIADIEPPEDECGCFYCLPAHPREGCYMGCEWHYEHNC